MGICVVSLVKLKMTDVSQINLTQMPSVNNVHMLVNTAF